MVRTERRELHSPDRPRVVLVNRDFWKEGNVIGEALLALAERLSGSMSVAVVTQSRVNLASQLAAAGRGQDVHVCAIAPLTSHASSLLRKGLEAVRFAVYAFVALWKLRPAAVYVATNPPILVPFLCMLYCKWASARLVYHVQDIHPEITNIVAPMHPWLFRILKMLECNVLTNASEIVTINAIMRDEILQRSLPLAAIHVLENPALDVDTRGVQRSKGFIYCGNAGRLQRIPVLLEALRKYYVAGGKLPFFYVGGGYYKSAFESLSLEFPHIRCLGEMAADAAARAIAACDWAVLPLEDSVMKFAFPSKSATYVLAGARILAISSPGTALATWVEQNGYGLNAAPESSAVAKAMMEIEQAEGGVLRHSHADLLERYGIPRFVEVLAGLLSIEVAHGKEQMIKSNRTTQK